MTMTAPTCRGRSSKDTAIKTDDDWNRRRRSALFFSSSPGGLITYRTRRVQRSTPIVAVVIIWLAQTDLTRHAAGKRNISFVLSSTSVLFCDPRSLSNIGPRLFVASRCRRYFRIKYHSIDAFNTSHGRDLVNFIHFGVGGRRDSNCKMLLFWNNQHKTWI